MHSRGQELTPQQLAATININTGISGNLNHNRSGILVHLMVNISLGGPVRNPSNRLRGSRLNPKSPRGAGQIPLIHPTSLEIILIAEILTDKQIVKPGLTVIVMF